MNPTKLKDLHPFEYEHPLDAKALHAMQNIKGLDFLIRQFNKQAVERIITIKCTGSSLKVTPRNYPDIYDVLRECCETINCADIPDLYIEWDYGINGYTIGVDHPIIVLKSGCIDLLSLDELRCVIGHEVGHIKSRHVLYHQMAQALPYLAEVIGNATFGIGNLVSIPINFALLKWQRLSELTADRAGLLAAQDKAAFIRLLPKREGVPLKHFGSINCEEFIRQAREFDKLDEDRINMLVKWAQIAGQDHPWTVLRAAELLRWIESGEYDAVLKRRTRGKVHKVSSEGVTLCRKCGCRLQGDEKLCPTCGQTLAVPETRIVVCPQCSQKLRMPRMTQHVRITCPSCKHAFSDGA